jgi:hypothetical protein
MFVVAKHLALREFERMKARLVVDGRDQDAALCPDKLSLTVEIHSAFTMLGIVHGDCLSKLI